MVAKGQHAGLRREIGPGLLEPVAGFAQLEAARVRLQHLQSPAQARGQAQRAVVIKPAVIEVAGRHAGRDADQAFGLLGGGEQLRHALIGKTVHADAAVRFGAGAQPGDGLGAVAGFVAERIKLAFGVAAAAHVLDHDVVAVAANQAG